MAQFILKLLNIHSNSAINLKDNVQYDLQFLSSTISEFNNTQKDLNAVSHEYSEGFKPIANVFDESHNYCYSYNESFEIHQNAQKKLSFTMDRYIIRSDGIEENPFVHNIVNGSQLLLIDKYGDEHLFTVTDISFTFKENNLIYEYSCEDSFTYQLSRQNDGYAIESDIESEDFLGAHDIDWWASNIIVPECHISYKYVRMNESLVQLDNLTCSTSSNVNNIKRVIKRPMARYNADGTLSTYFESLSFAGSGTSNSVLISLAEQLSLQIQTFEYLNEETNQCYRYFWFEPKQKDEVSGLYYSPYSDISSFSLTHNGTALSTILNVSGGTFGADENEEIITLIPSVPIFFKRWFLDNVDWNEGSGLKFEEGLFTTTCQSKYTIIDNSINPILKTSIAIEDEGISPTDMKDYYTSGQAFIETDNNHHYIYIPYYINGKVELQGGLSKFYDFIKFSQSLEHSQVVIAESGGEYDTYFSTNNNWSLYAVNYPGVEGYINEEIKPFTQLEDQWKYNSGKFAYFIKFAVDDITDFDSLSLSTYRLYLNQYRDATEEELEFAEIADQCPWLENKLIDFNYFYNRGILNKKEYTTLMDLITNNLRQVNARLLLYAEEYYAAIHAKTKLLADLSTKLDTIGATFENDIIEAYNRNGQVTDTDNFKSAYNLAFADNYGETNKLFNYETTVGKYLNNYLNANQHFLKNIYDFQNYFNEKVSFLDKGSMLHDYHFTLTDNRVTHDATEFIYSFNNASSRIVDTTFPYYVQYGEHQGQILTPIYRKIEDNFYLVPSASLISLHDWNDGLNEQGAQTIYYVPGEPNNNMHKIGTLPNSGAYNENLQYYEVAYEWNGLETEDPALWAFIRDNVVSGYDEAYDDSISDIRRWKMSLKDDYTIQFINRFHLNIGYEESLDEFYVLGFDEALAIHSLGMKVVYNEVKYSDLNKGYLARYIYAAKHPTISYLQTQMNGDEIYERITDNYYPCTRNGSVTHDEPLTKTIFNEEGRYGINWCDNTIDGAVNNILTYINFRIFLSYDRFSELATTDHFKSTSGNTPNSEDIARYKMMLPISTVYYYDYATDIADTLVITGDKRYLPTNFVNAENATEFYRAISFHNKFWKTAAQIGAGLTTGGLGAIPFVAGYLSIYYLYKQNYNYDLTGYSYKDAFNTITIGSPVKEYNEDYYDDSEHYDSEGNGYSTYINFLLTSECYGDVISPGYNKKCVLVQEYSVYKYYNVNDLVRYNNNYYKCIRSNKNHLPSEVNSIFWTSYTFTPETSWKPHYSNFAQYALQTTGSLTSSKPSRNYKAPYGLLNDDDYTAFHNNYYYKTAFWKKVNLDDQINRNDTYYIILQNDDFDGVTLPFNTSNATAISNLKQESYTVGDKDVFRYNKTLNYLLENYIDTLDTSIYSWRKTQIAESLEIVLKSIYNIQDISESQGFITFYHPELNVNVKMIVLHEENYSPRFLNNYLNNISLEDAFKELDSNSYPSLYYFDNDAKVVLQRDFPDFTNNFYFILTDDYNLIPSTSFDMKQHYYRLLNPNEEDSAKRQFERVFTLENLICDGNYFYYDYDSYHFETMENLNRALEFWSPDKEYITGDIVKFSYDRDGIFIAKKANINQKPANTTSTINTEYWYELSNYEYFPEDLPQYYYNTKLPIYRRGSNISTYSHLVFTEVSPQYMYEKNHIYNDDENGQWYCTSKILTTEEGYGSAYYTYEFDCIKQANHSEYILSDNPLSNNLEIADGSSSNIIRYESVTQNDIDYYPNSSVSWITINGVQYGRAFMNNEDMISFNVVEDNSKWLDSLTNGQFWYLYHNDVKNTTLIQYAAMIESTLMEFWTGAFNASKSSRWFLPEYWQPNINQQQNRFCSNILQITERVNDFSTLAMAASTVDIDNYIGWKCVLDGFIIPDFLGENKNLYCESNYYVLHKNEIDPDDKAIDITEGSSYPIRTVTLNQYANFVGSSPIYTGADNPTVIPSGYIAYTESKTGSGANTVVQYRLIPFKGSLSGTTITTFAPTGLYTYRDGSTFKQINGSNVNVQLGRLFIKPDSNPIINLTNTYIPSVKKLSKMPKYTFKYFQTQDDYNKYVTTYEHQNKILDNNYISLSQALLGSSDIPANEVLQDEFKHLQLVNHNYTDYKNFIIALKQYDISYYISEGGGTEWQKILNTLTGGSIKADFFGGWYEMAIYLLIHTNKYTSQSCELYDRYLKRHNELWDIIYKLFPNVVLEQNYTNEDATSSAELLKMAKIAFNDYKQVERNYNITTIDINHLKGYEGQKVTIGQPIAIDAEEYYDEYDDLKTSLQQYLFVSDISYSLRSDKDINFTVNTIKYGDKVIKQLIKLIR